MHQITFLKLEVGQHAYMETRSHITIQYWQMISAWTSPEWKWVRPGKIRVAQRRLRVTPTATSTVTPRPTRRNREINRKKVSKYFRNNMMDITKYNVIIMVWIRIESMAASVLTSVTEIIKLDFITETRVSQCQVSYKQKRFIVAESISISNLFTRLFYTQFQHLQTILWKGNIK